MLINVPSLLFLMYTRVCFQTSSGHSMYHQNFMVWLNPPAALRQLSLHAIALGSRCTRCPIGVRTLKWGDSKAVRRMCSSSRKVLLIQCFCGLECTALAVLDCANELTRVDTVASRESLSILRNCLLVRTRCAVFSPMAAVIDVYTWERRNLTHGAVLAMKTSIPMIFSISFTVNDFRCLWKGRRRLAVLWI